VSYIGIAAVVAVTAAGILSGVYLGLKWNVQLRRGEAPTVELPKLPNPLAAARERREEKQADNILDEWLNGEKEVR
jgi:hypothetical protein